MFRLLHNIYSFYREGFRSMTVGKRLWIIIFIKLFLMFAVFRLFFFKPYLSGRFNDNKSKSEYVTEQLLRKPH